MASVLPDCQRRAVIPLADGAVNIIVKAGNFRMFTGYEAVIPVQGDRPACMIRSMHQRHQAGNMFFIYIPPFHPAHFIFQAPDHHARMVSIPFYQFLYMSPAVIQKNRTGSVHGFSRSVNGRFIHDQHAHLIRGIQIICRMRLRMKTDAVHAALPADAKPVFCICLRLLHSSLEMPGIPPKLYRNAVEIKQISLRPKLPEAKTHGMHIVATVCCGQFCLPAVKKRILRIPVNGILPWPFIVYFLFRQRI